MHACLYLFVACNMHVACTLVRVGIAPQLLNANDYSMPVMYENRVTSGLLIRIYLV